MSYAHKLAVYNDPPHKKVVYCIVCGQDTNLSSPCPGEYVPTPEQQAIIDKQFRDILGDTKPSIWKNYPLEP